MGVGLALIRGINVGGKHLLPMELLRSLCDKAGLAGARTYIQSGNVVFRASAQDLARAPAALSDAIEQRMGFRPSVMVRTLRQLRAVAAANPFTDVKKLDGSRLLVMFLTRRPVPSAGPAVAATDTGPDRARLVGREVFLLLPGGVGKSLLSMSAIEAAVGAPGTCRNWNTVTRLLEMAEELHTLA